MEDISHAKHLGNQTNFDVLYTSDFDALVDLLSCYMPGHTCAGCAFRKYEQCQETGDEAQTVHWLAATARKDSLDGGQS